MVIMEEGGLSNQCSPDVHLKTSDTSLSPLDISESAKDRELSVRDFEDTIGEPPSPQNNRRPTNSFCSRLKVSAYYRDAPDFFYTQEGCNKINATQREFENRPLSWQDTISRTSQSGAVVQAYACRNESGLEDYLAVKEVSISNQEKRQQASKEIQLLSKVRNKHIVAYVGSYIFNQLLCIMIYPVAKYNLTDFLKARSDHIEHNQTTSKAEVQHITRLKCYFSCLCNALHSLHAQNIKHKDIKPENILIDKFNTVLLTDFDRSTQYRNLGAAQSEGPTACTVKYSAPEIVHGLRRKGMMSDIFSLGCVFLEMVTVVLGHPIRALYRAVGDMTGTGKHCKLHIAYWSAVKKGKVDEWVKSLEKKLDSQPDYDSVRRISSRHLSTILQMMADFPAERPSLKSVRQVFDSLRDKCDDCMKPLPPSPPSTFLQLPDQRATPQGQTLKTPSASHNRETSYLETIIEKNSTDDSSTPQHERSATDTFASKNTNSSGTKVHNTKSTNVEIEKEVSKLQADELSAQLTSLSPKTSNLGDDKSPQMNDNESIPPAAYLSGPLESRKTHVLRAEEPAPKRRRSEKHPTHSSNISSINRNPSSIQRATYPRVTKHSETDPRNNANENRQDSDVQELRVFKGRKYGTRTFRSPKDIPGRYIIIYNPKTESIDVRHKAELNLEDLKKGILVWLPRGIGGRKFITVDKEMNLWKRLTFLQNMQRGAGFIRTMFQMGDYRDNYLLQ